MMRAMTTTFFRDGELLDGELLRWLRLEESLLVEMAQTHHGYSFRLVFKLWDVPGFLRSDLPKGAHHLTVEMQGVQRLRLEGGLSQVMLEHPEGIDWGLSEVALVRAEPSSYGLQLQVLWEGERQIVIDAASAYVLNPEG
jgi:hypothetical protein